MAEGEQLWCYLNSEGEEQEAVAASVLRLLTKQGEVGPETLVWTEGMEEWTAAGAVEGLLEAAEAKRSTPMPTAIAKEAEAQAQPIPLQSAHPEPEPEPSADLPPLISQKRPKPKALRIVGLAVFFLWALPGVFLSVLFETRESTQKVLLGTTEEFDLGFITGINGYWEPRPIEVIEKPLDLGDGTTLDWKFSEWSTNNKSWGASLEDGPKVNATMKFTLPQDNRLVGKTLQFRLKASIKRPIYSAIGSFRDKTESHDQQHEFKVVSKRAMSNQAMIKLYAYSGIFVFLIGSLLFAKSFIEKKSGGLVEKEPDLY